jgi:hypothetical protein
MSIIIQTQFSSAVVEENQDIYTESYIEDSKTIIAFDVRVRDYQKEFNTASEIRWKDPYTVDVCEFSTYQNPIIYRFTMAQGYYTNDEHKRIYFTPKVSEVSTQRHVSLNVIRLSCFLAVVCGVTLRNVALIFNVLFQIPVTKSSIKRWIDEIGANHGSEEEILKQLVSLKKPTECHIDGYYPLGTPNCVMVVKDDYDRILITHEAESENYEAARVFLKKIKAAGVSIHRAYSDYSESYIKAIKEVFPDVKFQADHFHTVKNIWKHLKKTFLKYRKALKQTAEDQQDDKMLDLAKKLWKMRWTILKKPSNLTLDEKQMIADLEKEDSGFIGDFRKIIKRVVSLFDKSNSELQAKVKLKALKIKIEKMENAQLSKVPKFLTDHWNEAMQYLKKRGPAKARRSSNSESGMRILRRLEKNHDGIRSERTRKHYIKIYQSIKYLSKDLTDFLSP